MTEAGAEGPPAEREPEGGRVAFLGIDLGTTEAKAGLVTLDGVLLGAGRAGYPTLTDGADGRAEQDAEDWWRAVVRAVRDARAGAGGLGVRVAGIAVDGHSPSPVPVDGAGRPTRLAITWLDARLGPDRDAVVAATGVDAWGIGALPAARWTAREDPDAARRTSRWLDPWGFVSLRLSGVEALTRARGQVVPDGAMATAAGLDPRLLPPVRESGEVLGRLTHEAAATLGLEAGIPIVAGLFDAWASCFGAGLLTPGDALDTGGTGGGLAILADRPIAAQGIYSAPAPLPGRWILGGAMAATGRALDWLRDDVLRGAATTDRLLAEAAAVPAGAEGLVFLPYLAGERSPIWDPEARGVFAGLSLRHGRGHLARAVLEAAALALRHVAEPVLGVGIAVTGMRVAGGPARSELWNRIKADVTGFPVLVPRIPETAVVGSAILAAAGVGAVDGVEEGMRRMVRIERRVEPRPEVRPTYDALYAAYRELYPAVAPTMRRLRRAIAAGTAGGAGREAVAVADEAARGSGD